MITVLHRGVPKNVPVYHESWGITSGIYVHRLDFFGGYVKISTSLHRGVGQNDNSITCGGEAQMITILHKGGGLLGPPKMFV